jgi:hypothetical protein
MGVENNCDVTRMAKNKMYVGRLQRKFFYYFKTSVLDTIAGAVVFCAFCVFFIKVIVRADQALSRLCGPAMTAHGSLEPVNKKTSSKS